MKNRREKVVSPQQRPRKRIIELRMTTVDFCLNFEKIRERMLREPIIVVLEDGTKYIGYAATKEVS